MQRRRYFLILSLLGLVLLIATGILLATAHPVSAQCGSATSSCKSCHEVQGKKPVNNDGTAWHKSHAFGDFCVICHGGNSQSTDETVAHTGMVPPLSDIKASCQQCHAKDLTQRAQVYATTLGIKLESGASGSGASKQATSVPDPAGQSAAGSAAAPAGAAASGAVANAALTTQLNVNDPNLVDFAKNYDEIVLHKTPINWGNVILLVVIALLVVGGGGYVIFNEKLVRLSFGNTKAVTGEYPSDAVDMLPAITRLNARARQSLKKILGRPEKTEKVLSLMDAVVTEDENED